MRAPAITQENVNNQREAVKEERRLRMDNQPYGRTSEVIGELLFENFANEHSIIGSMADLDAASLEDFAELLQDLLRAEQRRAGDCRRCRREDRAREGRGSTSKAFRPDRRRRRSTPTEPAQKEERRTVVNDPLARLTLVDIAYQMPGGISPDMDALSALATVMGSGRSSRLYESLVRQQQVAVQAGAGVRAGERADVHVSRRDGRAREGSRRSGESDLRRGREGSEGPDSGMGARQGAQRRAAEPGRQAWAARCSAPFCSRATPCSTTTPRSSTRATSASRR